MKQQTTLVKKSILFFMILSLSICSLLGQISVSDAKSTLTLENMKASYVVMDASSGAILASNKENRKVYPASTTKVLTVCTFLDKIEQDNIPLTRAVTFTKKMKRSIPYGSKCVYLHVKSKYTYQDLIGLVMVASAADAVIALEIALFGSESNLKEAMNKKAAEIGMTHSYFDNGIGLDKNNGYKKIHTTASDMMKLCKYARDNYPLIQSFSCKKRIKVRDVSQKHLHNFQSTNQFYYTKKFKNTDYKIVGMKTGYTNAASSTLMTRAVGKTDSSKELLVVVFHIGKNESVYDDTKLLLDTYWDSTDSSTNDSSN